MEDADGRHDPEHLSDRDETEPHRIGDRRYGYNSRVSQSAHSPGPVAVFSIPAPLAENPYQRLLYDQMAAAGLGRLEADFGGFVAQAKECPGVVHAHWLFARGRWPLPWTKALRHLWRLRSAERHAIPLVWTAHNLEPHQGSRCETFLHDRLLASADGVIAHDRMTARALESRGFERVAIIPHGHFRDAYPPPVDRGSARQILGLDEERPVFLAFGRLAPYKGFETLIQTFARLPMDATLLVVGSPTSSEVASSLRSLAASDSRIRIHSQFVPQAEVATWFGASDWVVLPFKKITTSGSLILALSMGRPAIIPVHPGLQETADNNAVELFDGTDDLGNALQRALDRDRSTAEAAATRSCDRLAWGPIAEATVRFYRECWHARAR